MDAHITRGNGHVKALLFCAKKPAMATKRNPSKAAPKRAKKATQTPLVGILTGSPNDVTIVDGARKVLESLGVPCELKVLSAHRTPERVTAYLQRAEAAGVEVFIACAGMAAHLAGAVAAQTLKPVIGVPLASGPLSGMDALLATVQMPPGIPVATVAVDGAKNAGYLAARILAATRPELTARIAADLDKQRQRYDQA